MKNYIKFCSLGGPEPYIPVGLNDTSKQDEERKLAESNSEQMRRARVLCSYDAKDHTELSLNSHEVIILFFNIILEFLFNW